MGMKDEILKQLMDDLAVYYPPNIDGMESIEDIIKKSSNSDLQLRLIALKEFILKEKLTDANLYRPLYDDNFGDTELDIIEHYIKTDAKLDPEHAKVLNRIAELIGFKYTDPKTLEFKYNATQRVKYLTDPSVDMSINSSIVNQLTRYLAADINQQLAVDINQQLMNYLASESQNDLQDPFSSF
jgi:hypothetical protein